MMAKVAASPRANVHSGTLISSVAAACVLLVGSASAAETLKFTRLYSAEARAVIPEPTATAQAEIGEVILYQGVQAVTPAIELEERLSMNDGKISIGPGVLARIGEDGEGYIYRTNEFTTDPGRAVAMPRSAGVYLPKGANGQPMALWMYTDTSAKAEPIATPKYRETVHRQLLKQANRRLIYTGLSGSTLKLNYMEFDGDMARPAFSQELSYDLSTSDEIGYKGARIKVIKATNTRLEYVVLEGMR